MQKTYFKTKS